MFPLGNVLFPRAVMPLHVFEPRYRVMMRHCLDGDGEFGVVLIERGSEVGGGDTRFDTGTLARIVHANELPDGRYAITAVGIRPIRVVQWLPDDPFPIAEIDDDADATASELPADDLSPARDRVIVAFEGVLELWHQLDARVPTTAPPPTADVVQDLFFVAASAPLGPLDAQRVLEAPLDTRGLVLERALLDLAEELRGRIALG